MVGSATHLKKSLGRFGPGLLLLLLFVLSAAGRVEMGFVDQLEAWCYDIRLNLTLSDQPDGRIVIVDIDEKSLAEEGRWPWSRDRLARMLDQLFEHYQIAVVGFDVVFAEEDNSSGLGLLEELGKGALQGDPVFDQTLTKLRPSLDYDGRFAEAMADRPVVLGYYFNNGSNGQARTSGELPPPVFSSNEFADKTLNLVRMDGYGANLSVLQARAHSAGHFNPYTDPDGKCRRIPMLIEHRGALYESLSLAMLRTLLWDPDLVAGFPTTDVGGSDYRQLEWLGFADFRIPVDGRARALIPFRGYQGSFRYLSAADVLHGRVDKAVLEGALVLVGTTAPGLMDLRATPVSAVYPGVEIHANMIAGILDGTVWHRPAWVTGAEVALLVIVGLVLALCLPLLGPLAGMVLTGGVLATVLGLNMFAWKSQLVIPLGASLLLMLGIYLWNMSYGFLVEARHKRRITGLFGQYVPPELVEEMSKNPQKFTLEGESRELTVLFSDVRGFTTLSESMDPRDLSRLMNEYMTPMTRIIHRHRGTIDKYIGDAIMAFWGAPMDDPEHAKHGLQAALEMQQELSKLRPQFLAQGWPEIRMGIGLNTGVMSVGNMGSEFRMAYTVLGDAVNLGSRLEGLTANYGVGIIVGEATRAAVPEMVYRELDRVRVKGKARPVSIFEPLGEVGLLSVEQEQELEHFGAVLSHYRSRNWSTAEDLLQSLLAVRPDEPLYGLYMERLQHFRQFPPPDDWDGVFR